MVGIAVGDIDGTAAVQKVAPVPSVYILAAHAVQLVDPDVDEYVFKAHAEHEPDPEEEE